MPKETNYKGLFNSENYNVRIYGKITAENNLGVFVEIMEDHTGIQRTEYIEDGWFILLFKGADNFELYEIPPFGGSATKISTHATLIEAIEAANKLT